KSGAGAVPKTNRRGLRGAQMRKRAARLASPVKILQVVVVVIESECSVGGPIQVTEALNQITRLLGEGVGGSLKWRPGDPGGLRYQKRDYGKPDQGPPRTT